MNTLMFGPMLHVKYSIICDSRDLELTPSAGAVVLYSWHPQLGLSCSIADTLSWRCRALQLTLSVGAVTKLSERITWVFASHFNREHQLKFPGRNYTKQFDRNCVMQHLLKIFKLTLYTFYWFYTLNYFICAISIIKLHLFICKLIVSVRIITLKILVLIWKNI